MNIYLINFFKLCENFLEKLTVNSEIKENVKLELKNFCHPKFLKEKLQREVGTLDLFELKKIDFENGIFEGQFPQGTLLHILPGNAELAGFLCLIEGLLTGNSNILKLSSKDTLTKKLIKILESCDISGVLKNKIKCITQDELSSHIYLANMIIVWGSSETVENIKSQTPANIPVLSFGHKISFGYVTKSIWCNEKAFEDFTKRLAFDVFIYNQEACSAPQVIFIEDAEWNDLILCTEQIKKSFALIAKNYKMPELSLAERAEITNLCQLKKLEALNEKVLVSSDSDYQFVLITENEFALTPSPLNRTIFIRPAFRDQIVNRLSPLKDYLQTVGLEASQNEFAELIPHFLQAGALRIREVGQMQDSYIGEPHDGLYSLSRYLKRISWQNNTPQFKNISRLSELQKIESQENEIKFIAKKEDFQNNEHHDVDLYFKSGGSSGKTAVSPFTYYDYHRMMEAGAEGLIAAGLRPKADRVMNLFYAGGLYGGFLSFYTILEKIKATQFPMAAHQDLAEVASSIVEFNVDTLLGMPSYLIKLFQDNHDKLKKYGGVKKIFFGGEHFPASMRDYLKNEFGVTLIASASYGSVDAGPMGYQCEFSSYGVHHLHESIQMLDILKLDSLEKVSGEEVGRLIFSNKIREAITVQNYEIGDIGQWVFGQCECGRKHRRFRLLGRQGEVFRVGGSFINYQRLQSQIELTLQIIIQKKQGLDHLVFVTNQMMDVSLLINSYPDLKEIVVEKVLTWEHQVRDQLIYTHAGKLKKVIDERVL